MARLTNSHPAHRRGVWHKLPANSWEKFEILRKDKCPGKQADFFKGGWLSEKTLRRAAEAKEITEDSLKALAKQLGHDYDWQSVLIALGGKPPPPEVLFFGEIQSKDWQRLPQAECPHPHPAGNNSTPPFKRNVGGNIFFAKGWILRLRANAYYRVTCDFVRNNAWPEIEIVLYERVPHTESWKRAGSFGAVTSRNCASDVTPQVEEWLVTCWGKKVIADDARWIGFAPVPDAFELDAPAGLLKLGFSAPNQKGGKGGSSSPTSTPESCPVVHVRLVK